MKLISFSAEPVLLCGGKLLWHWARRSRIPSLNACRAEPSSREQHGAARSVAGGSVLLTSAHGSRVLPLVSVIQAVSGLCRGAPSSVKAHLAALTSITKSPVPAVLAQLATHFRTQPPVLTSKRPPETPAWFSGWCLELEAIYVTCWRNCPRVKNKTQKLKVKRHQTGFECRFGPIQRWILFPLWSFEFSSRQSEHVRLQPQSRNCHFDASRSANKTRYATLIDSTSVTVTVAAANVLLLIPRKETFFPQWQFDLTHGSLAMTHTQAVVLNYTINISAIQLCPWNDK